MKHKFTAIFGSMISAIIAMLGFSSCSESDEPFEDIPLMYGTPHAEFKFSGLVTDENGKPIDKARVIVRPYGYGDGHYILHQNAVDTVSTDVAGKYKGELSCFPSQKIVLVCEDPRGAYQTDSVEVRPKYENGDHNWDFGVAKAEANFKLKKAAKEEGK